MRAIFLFILCSSLLFSTGKVAIVIDDIGNDFEIDSAFLNLPKEITFAVFADGEELDSLLKLAKVKNHEVIIHLPMEAFNDLSPLRKNLLLVKDSQEVIREKMFWHLSQVKGAIGINNHTGSAFTSNVEGMGVVMEVLKEKGLFFLDSFTFQGSKGKEVADQYKVPCQVRDVFLDNVPEVQAILAQLKLLEAVANKKGQAIAIGHPHRETLEALKTWLGTTTLKVVPLSTFYPKKQT